MITNHISVSQEECDEERSEYVLEHYFVEKNARNCAGVIKKNVRDCYNLLWKNVRNCARLPRKNVQDNAHFLKKNVRCFSSTLGKERLRNDGMGKIKEWLDL